MAVRTRNVQRELTTERNYYNEGNTARAYARELQFEEPKRTINEPARRSDWQRREDEENERQRRNRVLRAQKRALSYSRSYVIFLSMSFCVMFLVCGCYLYLQSTVNRHLSTIGSMQNQIMDLRSENDENLQRITSSVDLNAVREKAINELGMTYPRSSQIVYYSVDESDTMTQYAEVP